MPTGPSVMALPGSTKTFDQFRADDNSCRQFALQQVGGVDANQAATNSAVGSAVVGTAFGAAAGAAFGGGSGAAIGAGAGLPDRQCVRRRCIASLGLQRAAALRLRVSAVHVRRGRQGAGARPRAHRPALWLLLRHHTAATAAGLAAVSAAKLTFYRRRREILPPVFSGASGTNDGATSKPVTQPT